MEICIIEKLYQDTECAVVNDGNLTKCFDRRSSFSNPF